MSQSRPGSWVTTIGASMLVVASGCGAESTGDEEQPLGTTSAALASWANAKFSQVLRVNAQESVAGAQTNVFGRVHAAGVTDTTPMNDPDPRIQAQVGYGPGGSFPVDNSWFWAPATSNPLYGPGSPSHEPSYDEYVGTLTAPGSGVYDFAYRFSGNGGADWVNCDADVEGSANGYSPADAGQMFVE
jgi:hypothetical protein